MASIRQLAGHTLWYGLSSMVARFLNYLLTPFLTYILTREAYGEMSLVYAMIPFMNVIFTYGMETTFFRFSNQEGSKEKVSHTINLSILLSTALLAVLLYMSRDLLASFIKLKDRPEFIQWAIWIIVLDTLTVIPFAQLRNEGRPRKYAFIRIAGILVNIACVLFFYLLLPRLAAGDPGSFWGAWYDPEMGVGYVFIANIVQAAFTLLLLLPRLLSVRLYWDPALWKKLMLYGFPIMIAGLGGMINESFDRIMLGWLSAAGSEEAVRAEIGVYAACYKLSILITLFIQAFRMGAEPFFFQQAGGTQAPQTYARVMRYFFIALCLMFLFIVLYLDFWKYFIDRKMWAGLRVVPVLLLANMCLGIYYNLSIWYKISGSTRPGAYLTFAGAGITLLINYLFIPEYGYMACAWATLACYGLMMLLSWYWGQKVYPVPYELGILSRYFLWMMGAYLLHRVSAPFLPGWISGTVLFFLYITYILYKEREMVRTLPLIGKWFR